MRNTARHLYLQCIPDRRFSTELGRFTSIISISLDIIPQPMQDASMRDIFGRPSIQKSLQSLHINWTFLSAEMFALMAKCLNVRWIHISTNPNVSANLLAPIIYSNRSHLVELRIECCKSVGDGILHAISCCTALKWVHLKNVGVSAEAIEKYKAERRSNWQAIEFVQGEVFTEEVEATDTSDDSSTYSSSGHSIVYNHLQTSITTEYDSAIEYSSDLPRNR